VYKQIPPHSDEPRIIQGETVDLFITQTPGKKQQKK
jgi:hypothetical protein